METNSEIIIYTASDGTTKLHVQLEDETVWLMQEQMAVLSSKDRTTVNPKGIEFQVKDIVIFERKLDDMKKGTKITKRAHGIIYCIRIPKMSNLYLKFNS